MKTINCVGCGKLAKTVLKLMVDNKLATIGGIVNQSLHSARAAVNFIGQGVALAQLDGLPPADLYFITTPDATIQAVCEELANKKIFKPHSIIVHFSGSLTSDILLSARKLSCLVASVHPVKSFADPATAVSIFKGTYLGVEGDPEALPVITKLLEAMGGVVFSVNKENKRQYHAAMVIANNYLTTLHYQAVKNLVESGVEEAIAKNLISMLMTDSLNNVIKFNHKAALTGPIQRGDIATVKGHMEAIAHDPIKQAIYAALGKGTLSLTSHEATVKDEIERILSL